MMAHGEIHHDENAYVYDLGWKAKLQKQVKEDIWL